MQSTQNQVTESVTTPAVTLQLAAVYLERFGWTKGRYFDGDGHTPAACLDGAVLMVCHGQRTDHAASKLDVAAVDEWYRALDALEGYLGERFGYLRSFHFNDSEGRTAAQAIQALKDAAAWFTSRDGAA